MQIPRSGFLSPCRTGSRHHATPSPAALLLRRDRRLNLGARSALSRDFGYRDQQNRRLGREMGYLNRRGTFGPGGARGSTLLTALPSASLGDGKRSRTLSEVEWAGHGPGRRYVPPPGRVGGWSVGGQRGLAGWDCPYGLPSCAAYSTAGWGVNQGRNYSLTNHPQRSHRR